MYFLCTLLKNAPNCPAILSNFVFKNSGYFAILLSTADYINDSIIVKTMLNIDCATVSYGNGRIVGQFVEDF